jgi:hypothetical protein
MPALDQITANINTAMQNGNFNTRKFQIAKYYNITDVVKTSTTEGDKLQPYVIDDSGNCINVVYDDKYNFQVFHVVDNITYKQADPNYGNPGQTMEETAEMILIFFGNRKKLMVRPEDIAAAICMDIPKELPLSFIQPLGMNSVVIETNIIETDPYIVWNNQWQGTTSFVKPETILLAVKYTIVSTYNKNCFKLCP